MKIQKSALRLCSFLCILMVIVSACTAPASQNNPPSVSDKIQPVNTTTGNNSQTDGRIIPVVSLSEGKPMTSSLKSGTPPIYVREAPYEYRKERQKYSSVSEIRVWIIGEDFISPGVAPVDGKNDFVRMLSWDERRNLKNKKYSSFLVLTQTPPESDHFGVNVIQVNDTIRIIKKESGNQSAIIHQPFPANWIALEPGIQQFLISSGTPDSFESFLVEIEDPWIKIDPLGNHTVGERFDISGTTNLPAGEEILVQMYPKDFKKTQCQCADGNIENGIIQTIQVQQGDKGINYWIITVDTTDFKPKEEIVAAFAVVENVSAHSTLFLLPKAV